MLPTSRTNLTASSTIFSSPLKQFNFFCGTVERKPPTQKFSPPTVPESSSWRVISPTEILPAHLFDPERDHWTDDPLVADIFRAKWTLVCNTYCCIQCYIRCSEVDNDTTLFRLVAEAAFTCRVRNKSQSTICDKRDLEDKDNEMTSEHRQLLQQQVFSSSPLDQFFFDQVRKPAKSSSSSSKKSATEAQPEEIGYDLGRYILARYIAEWFFDEEGRSEASFYRFLDFLSKHLPKDKSAEFSRLHTAFVGEQVIAECCSLFSVLQHSCDNVKPKYKDVVEFGIKSCQSSALQVNAPVPIIASGSTLRANAMLQWDRGDLPSSFVQRAATIRPRDVERDPSYFEDAAGVGGAKGSGSTFCTLSKCVYGGTSFVLYVRAQELLDQIATSTHLGYASPMQHSCSRPIPQMIFRGRKIGDIQYPDKLSFAVVIDDMDVDGLHTKHAVTLGSNSMDQVEEAKLLRFQNAEALVGVLNYPARFVERVMCDVTKTKVDARHHEKWPPRTRVLLLFCGSGFARFIHFGGVSISMTSFAPSTLDAFNNILNVHFPLRNVVPPITENVSVDSDASKNDVAAIDPAVLLRRLLKEPSQASSHIPLSWAELIASDIAKNPLCASMFVALAKRDAHDVAWRESVEAFSAKLETCWIPTVIQDYFISDFVDQSKDETAQKQVVAVSTKSLSPHLAGGTAVVRRNYGDPLHLLLAAFVFHSRTFSFDRWDALRSKSQSTSLGILAEPVSGGVFTVVRHLLPILVESENRSLVLFPPQLAMLRFLTAPCLLPENSVVSPAAREILDLSCILCSGSNIVEKIRTCYGVERNQHSSAGLKHFASLLRFSKGRTCDANMPNVRPVSFHFDHAAGDDSATILTKDGFADQARRFITEQDGIVIMVVDHKERKMKSSDGAKHTQVAAVSDTIILVARGKLVVLRCIDLKSGSKSKVLVDFEEEFGSTESSSPENVPESAFAFVTPKFVIEEILAGSSGGAPIEVDFSIVVVGDSAPDCDDAETSPAFKSLFMTCLEKNALSNAVKTMEVNTSLITSTRSFAFETSQVVKC